jgi:hypothetical protein
MNIAEKFSQLYQRCKINSLRTLLEEKEYDLKYQQKQIGKAIDETFLLDQKPVEEAKARRNRILADIDIIKSHLPKKYGFKKTKKSPKKKSPKKKSPKKKSPKKC